MIRNFINVKTIYLYLPFLPLLTNAQLQYVLIYKQTLTWSEAERLCQQEGGYLATIKDAAQNQLFVDKLHKNKVSSAWIGLRIKLSESKWKWISTFTDSKYRNFHSETSKDVKNEGCAEMNSNGDWNQSPCNRKKAFICEYPGKALCENEEGTLKCTCWCGYEGNGLSCKKSKNILQDNAISIKDKCAIGKDNLLTKIDIGSEYLVRFEVYPLGFRRDDWNSVIHLSAFGDNVKAYGDRNPGVWFQPTHTNQLYICSAINGNKDKCFTGKSYAVSRKEWTQIVIKQSKNKTTSVHTFSISVNNGKVFDVINSNVSDFSNVAVYAGDPWSTPQAGYIRNLYIASSKLTVPVSKKTKNIVIGVMVVVLLIAAILAVGVSVQAWKRCKSKTDDIASSPNARVDSVDGAPRMCSDDDYHPESPLSPATNKDQCEYTYIDPKLTVDCSPTVGSSQLKFEKLGLDTVEGKFAKYHPLSKEQGTILYKEPSGVPRSTPPQLKDDIYEDMSGDIYEDLAVGHEDLYEDPAPHVMKVYEVLRLNPIKKSSEFDSTGTNEYENFVLLGSRQPNVYQPLAISQNCSDYEDMNAGYNKENCDEAAVDDEVEYQNVSSPCDKMYEN